jgi:hypothetical protein
MSARLEAAGDAFIVAAALFALGMASGSVLTTVVGPEPSPAITKTATQRVTLPPRTLPPRTIEVTRTIERASRSSQRVTVLTVDGLSGLLTSWRPMNSRRRGGIAGIAHIFTAAGDRPVALRTRTRIRIHMETA